jgi:hypothetical protein
MSATNITSKCRIASIAPDDAMILPHDANLRRMKFSERTPLIDCVQPTMAAAAEDRSPLSPRYQQRPVPAA